MTKIDLYMRMRDVSFEDVIEGLGYVAAVVSALTPLVAALRGVARALHARALETRSKRDDAITTRLVCVTDVAARALAATAAHLPRLTNDVREARRLVEDVQRVASRRKSVPPLLVLAIVLAASGCAGTELERGRTILSASARTLVATERELAVRYEAAGDRAREESTSYEAYAESMRRWFAAATAVEVAALSLRAAERSLDAIERGSDGDVRDVLACVGDALLDVLDALDGLVRVPDALVATVRVVRELAGGVCVPVTAYGEVSR